jgi:hypothetical protein
MVFDYIYILMRTNVFLALIVLCLSGCTHKDKMLIKTIDVGKMSGTYLWQGYGHEMSTPFNNLFYPMSILALDHNTVVVQSFDTLHYSKTDSNTSTIEYVHADMNPHSGCITTLLYNYTDNSMILDSRCSAGMGSAATYMYEQFYTPYPALKDHVQKLSGTRHLSGVVYDTVYRPGTDTLVDSQYFFSGNIVFTMLDDSTIQFTPDIFHEDDSTLHFKGTNATGHVDTFQTYMRLGNTQYTELIYDYNANSVIMTQQLLNCGSLKLQ